MAPDIVLDYYVQEALRSTRAKTNSWFGQEKGPKSPPINVCVLDLDSTSDRLDQSYVYYILYQFVDLPVDLFMLNTCVKLNLRTI